jgi:hypothetical protein
MRIDCGFVRVGVNPQQLYIKQQEKDRNNEFIPLERKGEIIKQHQQHCVACSTTKAKQNYIKEGTTQSKSQGRAKTS